MSIIATSCVTSALGAALLLVAGAGTAGAQQSSDDVKWITQCVKDNTDEGPSAPVILAYCTCMNNKMPESETRSITQWEKANPRTMEACSAEAGWKGK